MGNYAFGTAIDEKSLPFFEEKDKDDLFRKVISSDVFKNYASWANNQNGADSLENALHAILHKESLNQNPKYVYGYAYISLCLECGTELPYQQEIKVGYETDLIDQYLKEDFNISLDYLSFLNDELKLEFDDENDAPFRFFFNVEAVKAISKSLASIKITPEEIEEHYDNDDDKGCAYEHIAGLKENFDFCAEHGLALIYFAH